MCWITDRRGELATTFNKQLIFCHWQLLIAPNCHLLKDRLWIYVTFRHGKIMDNQCRKRGDSWISKGVCHIGNPILEILKGCSTLASSVLVRENFKLNKSLRKRPRLTFMNTHFTMSFLTAHRVTNFVQLLGVVVRFCGYLDAFSQSYIWDWGICNPAIRMG